MKGALRRFLPFSLEVSKLVCTFAAETLNESIMLGVNSPREPITPEFSREIRAALWRSMTGNLTAEEKAARRRAQEIRKKIKIEWK